MVYYLSVCTYNVHSTTYNELSNIIFSPQFSGESYIDCCKRLVPVLEKMENSPEHLLIVAHQAILRCIVTYLLKGDLRKLPNTKIPQHSLIRVTYLNGENIIDYIRTPVDHHEQGVVKSLLNDIEEPQSRIILKQVI